MKQSDRRVVVLSKMSPAIDGETRPHITPHQKCTRWKLQSRKKVRGGTVSVRDDQTCSHSVRAKFKQKQTITSKNTRER